MSNDCSRLMEFGWTFNFAWILPVMVAIVGGLLLSFIINYFIIINYYYCSLLFIIILMVGRYGK